MRKYLFLCLFFVGLIFVSSCSVDENYPRPIGEEKECMSSQTLRQLQAYNDAIMKDAKITRFSTGNKYVDADVIGGIYGFGVGESIGSAGKFFGTWGWAAYGTCAAAGTLVGAGVFSWKYYKRHRGCTVTSIMTEQLYTKMSNYCTNKLRIVDGDFENVEEEDNILNQLQIPEGYEEIEKIGIAHNIVLQDDDFGIQLMTLGNGICGVNGSPVHDPREPIGPLNPFPDDYVNPCAAELFVDNTFMESYDNELNMVDDYIVDGAFSYNDYLTDHPLVTSDATNILLLFMAALHNVQQTTGNMIQLVNDYIQTIEMNNELTTAERKQLYTGFIIAVYSFDLWNSNPVIL